MLRLGRYIFKRAETPAELEQVLNSPLVFPTPEVAANVHRYRVLTPDLATYLAPMSLDTPARLDLVVLEYPDPRGPWGIRGVAEMPLARLCSVTTCAVSAERTPSAGCP